MPIANRAAGPEFTLTHPTEPATWYSFRGPGVAVRDTVQVIHVERARRNTYTLPVRNARELWRRLKKQGFQRF